MDIFGLAVMLPIMVSFHCFHKSLCLSISFHMINIVIVSIRFCVFLLRCNCQIMLYKFKVI